MPTTKVVIVPMGLPFSGRMPNTVSSEVQVIPTMKSVNRTTKPL